jgi:phage-related minor tail protein
MSSLGKELQQTIRNLEKIRDSKSPPSDDVLTKLDKLYEQQIDLIDAAINKATNEYAKATTAMEEAAKKTKEAIDDLTKLEKSIEKVAHAIDMVTDLLSKVA